jgi:hypothetical protein
MHQLSGSTQGALDYNSTIIGALELSEKKWVLRSSCLALAGIRGTCWTLVETDWFLLSSV